MSVSRSQGMFPPFAVAGVQSKSRSRFCIGGCFLPSGNSSSPSGSQLSHHFFQENSSTGSRITALPSRRMETSLTPSKRNSLGRRRAWLRPFLKSLTFFIPVAYHNVISLANSGLGSLVSPLVVGMPAPLAVVHVVQS